VNVKAAFVLFVVASTTLTAQIDDLADSPWAAPMWDALERFRDDPICLPCINATDLTVLPGIGRHTSSRIIALVRSGVRDLDFIADSLCLSLDQRIILNACVQTDCSCGPTLKYALARTRLRVVDGITPDKLIRVDVDSDVGRIGGFVRNVYDSTTYGLWTRLTVGPMSLFAGNYTIRAGQGLLLGGGSFARSALQASASADIAPHIRPWTSTWLDAAQLGVGVSYSDSVAGSPTDIVVAVARRATLTSSYLHFNVAGSVSVGSSTFGGTAYTNAFDKGFSFSTETVVDGATVRSEIMLDTALNSGIVVSARGNKCIASVRWLHPQLHSPFGASPSASSIVANNAGLTLGVQSSLHLRGMKRPLQLESLIDLHSTLTNSYGRPLPARGIDILVDAVQPISKQTSFAARLRFEREEDGLREPDTDKTTMQLLTRLTARGDVTVQASPTVRLRMRVDLRFRSIETGMLMFVDAMWQPSEHITVRHRTTMFRAASIDVAGYTAELETDGSMRTFVGSGTGTHSITTLRFEPWSGVALGIAYSTTVRNDITTSSGAVQLDARLR